MSCISSSNLSVLVNRERLNYFLPSRGIRQRDPLSPYIFILCMEYLARLILCKVDAHSWSGIRTSRDGPTFSHIFFADDLILFAKATKRNCLTIKNTLDKFCSLSEQKIILSKSKIYFSPHTSLDNISTAERELSMRACSNFVKYLGVSILTSKRNTRAFNFLIDKLRSRLANYWKASTLSLAGRLTLSRQSPLPFPHTLCRTPCSTPRFAKRSKKLIRTSYGGDSTTKRRIHLLNWNSVTLPRAAGGLGIKISIHRNKALLPKHL